MRVLLVCSEEIVGSVTVALDAALGIELLGACSSLSGAQHRLTQQRPDIALVELGLPWSLALLESVMEDHACTAAIVLIAEEQMGLLQRAMLAGARGFSLLPIRSEDLQDTLRRVFAAECKRRPQSGLEADPDARTEHPTGRVIVISGIKGGIGRSVIAVNLAVALAEQGNGRVALMDGNGGQGDIALMLNAQPLHSLVDLAADPSCLDADLIRGALLRHASGLQVLFGAKCMEEGALVTPGLLSSALAQLRQTARHIVVDTGSEPGEVLGELLAAADVVMLVTTPELPALRRAAVLLGETQTEAFSAEKVRLVLNREGIAGGFSSSDIAQRLGMPVAVALPDDPALVAFSVNRGVPLVQSHPKSLLARRLQELACDFAAGPGDGTPEEGRRVPERNARQRLSRQMRLKEAW